MGPNFSPKMPRTVSNLPQFLRYPFLRAQMHIYVVYVVLISWLWSSFALFRRYCVEVCEETPSPLVVRNKGLTLAVRNGYGTGTLMASSDNIGLIVQRFDTSHSIHFTILKAFLNFFRATKVEFYAKSKSDENLRKTHQVNLCSKNVFACNFYLLFINFYNFLWNSVTLNIGK